MVGDSEPEAEVPACDEPLPLFDGPPVLLPWPLRLLKPSLMVAFPVFYSVLIIPCPAAVQ